MDQHQERAFTAHLDSLDGQQLANLKAHANAATTEHHDSFKQLTRYVVGVLGGIGTAGLTWKAIKIILRH